MIRVDTLIARLSTFPPDALAYAYEGEDDGIVIVAAQLDTRGLREQIDFIPTKDDDK